MIVNPKDLNQKGQTLPVTLMLTFALTITVSAVALSLMNQKKTVNSDKIRMDTNYASESAQEVAAATLKKYISENIGAYLSAQNSSGVSNVLGSNPASLFNTLRGNIITDKISSDAKNSNLKYDIYFFDDTNDSGTYDTGENSFIWIKKVDNPPNPVVDDNPDNDYPSQVNTFSYNITTVGYVLKNGVKTNKRKIINRGTFLVTTQPESFSKYALFTNKHVDESGNPVWFTNRTVFEGPVHTNAVDGYGFNFYGNPAGKFLDKVTSVASNSNGTSNIKWYNNNSNLLKTYAVGSYDSSTFKNGTKDIPNIEKGIEIVNSKVNLPDNTSSQERAAFGGDPATTTTVTAAEKATALGTTNPVPNGIYIPKNSSNIPKGGIYVQGNVDSITMDVEAPPTGSPAGTPGKQRYLIVQGSTRKLITLDKLNNQTIIKDINSNGNVVSGSEVTLNGNLRGALHVEGSINSLGGPTRTTNSNPDTAGAAIQKDNALTLSAAGDIIIQRDIKYEVDPRGPGLNGNAPVFGDGNDNLDAKNILGIFSRGGDVRIGASMPDNPSIHGTVMASSSGGVFKVDGYDNGVIRGNATLLGGVITEKYGAFGTFNSSTGQNSSGFGRNFVYDVRAKQKLLSPPYFPTTSKVQLQATKNLTKIDWNEVGYR